MLKLRTSALQSRVARRIFGVFLFCAIVPFIGLVLVSESHIDRYLNEKNRTQLRAMAKIFGMDIFERLTLLEASLENIASFVATKNGIAGPAVIKSLSSNPQIRWTAVTLLTAAGERQPILGALLAPPALTAAQKKRLASGKAALLVVPSAADSRPRLLMAMAINPLMPDHDLLIGEIDNRYLWNITASRALPSQIKPCVVSQFGAALRCAASESRVMPADFTKAIAHSATGDLEWSKDNETFIGSYWTLPLRYQFDTPEWVVFLRTTNSGLLAVVAVVLGVRIVLASPAGRLSMDRLLLRLPLVGTVILKTEVARWARVLGTLLRSGVPVINAMSVVRYMTSNQVLVGATERLVEGVKRGAGL